MDSQPRNKMKGNELIQVNILSELSEKQKQDNRHHPGVRYNFNS